MATGVPVHKKGLMVDIIKPASSPAIRFSSIVFRTATGESAPLTHYSKNSREVALSGCRFDSAVVTFVKIGKTVVLEVEPIYQGTSIHEAAVIYSGAIPDGFLPTNEVDTVIWGIIGSTGTNIRCRLTTTGDIIVNMGYEEEGVSDGTKIGFYAFTMTYFTDQ